MLDAPVFLLRNMGQVKDFVSPSINDRLCSPPDTNTRHTLGAAQGPPQCSAPGAMYGLSALLKGTVMAGGTWDLKGAAFRLPDQVGR